MWLYDPNLWYYYLADDAFVHCWWRYIDISSRFFKGNDAYVWLYDPTLWYYYLADDAIVHCWWRFTYISSTFCFRKRCVCVACLYPVVLPVLPRWWCFFPLLIALHVHIFYALFLRKRCVRVAVWPYPVVLLPSWRRHCPWYHCRLPLPSLASGNEVFFRSCLVWCCFYWFWIR